jgi:uncharacterized membrane protein
MRTNLRAELPHLAVIAAMFLLAAATWSSAPDRIPVHWDFAGRVDRYGGKFEGLLLMPLLTLGIYLLFLVAPRFDPGRANYARFWRPYWIMRLAAVVMLALVYGFILLWTWGIQLDVWTVVPVLVGGLFIVLGSVMGRIRPNWFVGIRTPWTLSSELSWTKTHRLGGRLFVLMGIALLASGFVGSTWGLLFDLAVVTGCVLWLLLYSYLVWRTDPEKISPTGTSSDDRE